MANIMNLQVSLPAATITNAEMAALLGVDPSDLLKYTKVKTKGVLSQQEEIITYAIDVARRSLDGCKIKISHVIFGTCYPDQKLFWYGSAALIKALNLKDVLGFDILNGCNSLLAGLNIANVLVEAGQASGVLVVVADRLSPVVDYKSITHRCIFSFADGAAATVVVPANQPSKYKILSYAGTTEASQCDEQYLLRNADKIWLNDNVECDRALVTIYREHYTKNIKCVLKARGLTVSDVAAFFVNQGDHKISNYLQESLGIHSERIVKTHWDYGHIGNADIALGLSTYDSNHKSGDFIVIASSAIGFSFSAMLIEII